MQDYNTIIGVVQMRLNGCQTRFVMDRFKIGLGTLNLIMSRYNAGGVPIEELRMIPPKEVENLFYPQANQQRKDYPFQIFSITTTAPCIGKPNEDFVLLAGLQGKES